MLTWYHKWQQYNTYISYIDNALVFGSMLGNFLIPAYGQDKPKMKWKVKLYMLYRPAVPCSKLNQVLHAIIDPQGVRSIEELYIVEVYKRIIHWRHQC